MIGWLGAAYPWVRALHVIMVIFWMSGLFMLPRFFIYHHPVAAGSAEDDQWIERERRLQRIILNPAMILTWVFGLMLAFNIGWMGGWLHAKLLFVLGLSGFQGWLGKTRKRFAAGERPVAEKKLRLLNEVPGIAIIIIVMLAVAKPF